MNSPRVDPVGVVEVPHGYATSPRVHCAASRLVASLVLAAFLGVSVTTTVLTLGVHCLTTWAGRPLPVGIGR